MGWVVITHPFHPLSQQRCEVLKRRRVSGVDTLIITHPQRGTVSVAKDWTDWAEPAGVTLGDVGVFELETLLELAALVNQLVSREGVDE